MLIDYSQLSEQDIKNINEIQEFLDSNNIEYSTEYGNFCLYFGNPGGKRSYEIQYIPSLMFPEAYPKYNIEGVKSNFFYKLSKQAEDNNSFICWVKDYEWNNPRKKEVLKSYFLHAAGKTPTRLYARDTIVKEVPTKEARNFESEHCFYGKRGASLSLGLYLKRDRKGIPAGTLMMIYTFGKNFFGKNNDIEVLRVGTRKYHQVIGGSSKLMKYFLNNYPMIKMGKKYYKVERIKFYSDYDHNIGSSMDSLGFKFVKYSGGGFMNYWINTGEVKHRQPTAHKHIMEEMKNGNVISCPNAGVKTFILDTNRNEEEYKKFEDSLKNKMDRW